MAKVFWYYGLSCSGKTTLADKFAEDNKDKYYQIERLDGDMFRAKHGNDLGFTVLDRSENIKRACYKADELSRNGITVVASFTTPFRFMRMLLNDVLGNRLELIFVDTPLEECIRRDSKGLYKKAFAGMIKNMVGVDIPFEYD